MIIGLIEMTTIPFFVWFMKSGCNYNNEDIFDSWQFGYVEIRKYKSKDSLRVWKTN